MVESPVGLGATRYESRLLLGEPTNPSIATDQQRLACVNIADRLQGWWPIRTTIAGRASWSMVLGDNPLLSPFPEWEWMDPTRSSRSVGGRVRAPGDRGSEDPGTDGPSRTPGKVPRRSRDTP
jgi:hypothetical protein